MNQIYKCPYSSHPKLKRLDIIGIERQGSKFFV